MLFVLSYLQVVILANMMIRFSPKGIKPRLQYVATTLCFVVGAIMLHAQQPAFPTAEGAGKFVTGGRGTSTTPTTVFEVTKLTDDGSVGTLRYALTNNSPTAPYI
jgi:hypothetical protein